MPVVCDPTLLFDGKDWMIIQEEAPIIEGEYILSIFWVTISFIENL